MRLLDAGHREPAGARSRGRQAHLRGAGTGRCLARRRVLGQSDRGGGSQLSRSATCSWHHRAGGPGLPHAEPVGGRERLAIRTAAQGLVRLRPATGKSGARCRRSLRLWRRRGPEDRSRGSRIGWSHAHVSRGSTGERSSGARRLRDRGRWLTHHRRGAEPAGAPQPPLPDRPGSRGAVPHQHRDRIRRLPAGGGGRPKRVCAKGSARADR